MEHARRLRGVWPYLPTFRFVAEEQHVGRAARLLGLNASSVSRAISDLERALGYAVFERRGRALHLNANGQRLLDVVRLAMRRLDDGVTRDVGLTGRVRVAADEPFLTVGVPRLVDRVRRDQPGIVLVVVRASAGEQEKLLLTGAVDVALGGAHRAARGLTSALAGELRTGLYAGTRRASSERADGDGWLDVVEIRGAPSATLLEPLGLQPRVIAIADDPAIAIGICRATGAAALVPELLAERLGGGELVRLALDPPAIPVHLVSREDMGGTPRIRAVVAAAEGLLSNEGANA